jgi:NAD(P)-dependent dehydrogenase (short-subunit alcohol dehydrogenase family)
MTRSSTRTSRTVVITGAGGGLGRAIALSLAEKGYLVFGTARNDEDVAEVQAASAGAVQMTICDVTDEAAVNVWANRVSAALGPDGLDVLVSNAGILTMGPLESTPLDQVRYAFEVNVFGSLAVINAFLPSLRAARGRIVQVGSMTGSFALPFAGPACASKAALESFAAAYRAELKPFGVDFVVARPGNMRTGGPAKAAADLAAVAESMTPEQRALYGAEFDTFTTALNNMQNSGLDPVRAAEYVIEAAEQTPAPIGVAVGPDAERILKLVDEKTNEQLDAMRRQFVGLKA